MWVQEDGRLTECAHTPHALFLRLSTTFLGATGSSFERGHEIMWPRGSRRRSAFPAVANGCIFFIFLSQLHPMMPEVRAHTMHCAATEGDAGGCNCYDEVCVVKTRTLGSELRPLSG